MNNENLLKLISDYDAIKSRIKKHTDLEIKTRARYGSPNYRGVYICCYAVMGQGVEVVYIGSSNDISKRLKTNNHPIYKYHGKGFSPLYIKCENHIELEKNLIKEFKPKYNVEHTRG